MFASVILWESSVEDQVCFSILDSREDRVEAVNLLLHGTVISANVVF